MPHHYVPPENVEGGRFWLLPAESAHLTRVLRKRRGDEILLFDGADRCWRAVIDRVNPARVEGRVGETLSPDAAAYTLRLFQAFPKGDRMEWVLEKGTELGVSVFLPVDTARAVGRLPADRAGARLERWRKILRAAAQQCGRARVPELWAPLGWTDALRRTAPAEWTVIPWESESRRTLKDAVRDFRRERPAERPVINVMIGPEGGFAPAEVDAAVAAGAVPVTLGPRILRTETAGLFAAAALLYELEL